MGRPELVGWCLHSVSGRTCRANTGDRYKTCVWASTAGRTAGQLAPSARHLPQLQSSSLGVVSQLARKVCHEWISQCFSFLESRCSPLSSAN